MKIAELVTFPALLAFAFSAALAPVLIPLLRRLKFGQYIREEGPEAHQKKAGTPTMGGFIFLSAFLIASFAVCVFMRLPFRSYAPVLALTAAFSLIGFLDDFLKVVMKKNEGLKPWQKFCLQILFAGGFAFMMAAFGFRTSLNLFGAVIDLGPFYYVFVIFTVVAVANGTNFTDGLDGLLSSVTSVIALFFCAAALLLGNIASGVVSASMLGALLGFLIFNAYPAKVFMGDTGALAIGGFVSAMAFVLNMPFIILLIGFVYVAEVLSVIIQVSYFKITGGKRIFKMAPIHHHFELLGWHETHVVFIFTIVTVLLCLVGLFCL